MRFLTRALIASALLACAPIHAAETDRDAARKQLEIDCLPEATQPGSSAQRAEGVSLDGGLIEKRNQVRAEELARAKARFMQQVRSTTSAEPVHAVLVPAQ